MVRVGSNISSLNAQRRLSASSAELQRSAQRLSSGLRIVRPSDDAAGLAIADSLRTEAKLFTVANRNLNDGLAMANIADSALEQQGNILVRLKELAEQSANGSLSTTQRRQLNKEYTKFVAEFGRIGSTTSFNGLNLLLAGRGSNPSNFLLQAGISAGSNSAISFQGINSGVLSGNLSLRDILPTNYGRGDGTFDFNDLLFSYAAIGRDSPITGGQPGVFFFSEAVDSSGQRTELGIIPADFYEDGGVVEVLFSVLRPTSDNIIGWTDSGIGGLPVLLSEANGFIIRFDAQTGKALPAGGTGTSGWDSSDPNFSAGITLDGRAATLSLDFRGLTISQEADSKTTSAIDFTSVRTVSEAKSALTMITQRLNELNAARGTLGATMSRLVTAGSVIEEQRSNTLAAESSIRDVDVAGEAAVFARLQILQNFGASILSQANFQPALALQLLQGG